MPAACTGGEEVDLGVETIHGRRETKVLRVSLEVSGLGLKAKHRGVVHIPEVYSTDTFPALLSSLMTDQEKDRWPHLRDIRRAGLMHSDVLLILGQDAPEAIAPLNAITGPPGHPYAVRTRLGWVISGPVGGSNERSSSQFATSNFISSSQISKDDQLMQQVEQFWKVFPYVCSIVLLKFLYPFLTQVYLNK